MATKNEMQAEIDRLTEKVERAEDSLRWLRELANSPKFRGSDPVTGETNGRMAIEDVTLWAQQTQSFIDEVDSFPWGLALRVTDRGTFAWTMQGGNREGVFSMNERSFEDVEWAVRAIVRERRSA